MSVQSVDTSEVSLVALVVEDNSRRLQAQINMLEAHGFTSIGVESSGDALRELRASPAVDIVLTDINLVPERKMDTSGVDLARKIKGLYSELPIVGISAAFEEDELPVKEWNVFDEYYPKGRSGPAEILEHVDKWRRRAEAHRAERMRRAEENLQRIRDKYPMESSHFSTLRFLVPAREADAGESRQTVEDLLRTAGYRLRLIERNASRPQLEGAGARVAMPILMWLKEMEGIVISEVYGYPELYSHGADEEEAVGNLLLLMDGFYDDLKSHEKEAVGNAKRMRDFLVHVFGE